MSRSDLVPQRRDRDLDDPTEIAEMVRRFYSDVAQDELLGPMFNEVARVDWSEHLPKLAAFWCRALLSRPGYEGNPYRAHLLVHARQAFTREHFVRWLDLFHETLDMGWEGPGVERAKALADKVAMVHSKQIIGEPVVYGNDGVIHAVEGRDADVVPVALNGRRPRAGGGW
jgi:hemoglobin